ncbi:putative naringenin-chalcone synthase [Hibiscus syriacus]|uniref:O-fucosyltransferase family protein n=1 Tax=Hibiscus syriacus TaxID=106335 RepID=A0A6A2WFH9_HIBSY|nr:putative naringenin-chalcone synthase [Hibiscus syriacus]
MVAHIAISMKPKSNNNCCSNGYSSDVSNGSNNSPSPPPSPPKPRLTPTLSQCRRRLRSKTKSFVRRESLGSGLNFRRNLRYLLLLPLLYVSGLLMCVGPFSGLLGYATVPGSVYRSYENFQRLWDDIRFDNSSALQVFFFFCILLLFPLLSKPVLYGNWSWNEKAKKLDGDKKGFRRQCYLIIDANGGLNQQRSAICNAVAVAGLLNAILVIPQFELNSVWRDPSQFGDIYDEDHFINNLKGYVNVVRELPEALMESYDRNLSNIPNFRVQAWASVNYYLGVLLPILRDQGVIRIAPFANRLTMNVPSHIQLLRCVANYKALKFAPPISSLAEKLVTRMIGRSSMTGGKYVSVHLRFEQDMVAFSCCVYDGGEAEKFNMDSFREKGWKGKFKRKDRVIVPALNRVEGKCPLTPMEMGNGETVQFWHDSWLGSFPLKVRFPRIFVLSLNKGGKVAEFMENSSSGCFWDIKLRRNLVDWEVEQWMQLMSLLSSTSLSSLQDDCWVWTGNEEGCFSAKSCVKCYFDWASNEEDDGTWDNIVWTGVAPPRVETFVWQAAHQRVAVGEELIKRGVSGIEDSLCPLCGKCVESVSHLFVHCEVVSGLWYRFLSSWNVSFVPPQTLLDFIIVWNDLIPKSTIWKFIPRAVLWTVWKCRNDIIFGKGKVDGPLLFFFVRFRIASWFVARFNDVQINFDSLVGDIKIVDLGVRMKKDSISSSCWTAPPLGYVKLNVDGAMSKEWDKGGIGGLLRDAQGLQQDSLNALKWIKNPGVCTPMFQPLVKDIAALVESRGSEIGLKKAVEALNGILIDGRLISVSLARYKIELIKKALAKDGIDIQIARWGHVWNSCVIVFNSTEEMMDIWMNRKELMNLVGRWGTLVDIHDATRYREDLTLARFLSRVTSPFAVPEATTIASHGRSFKSVDEEDSLLSERQKVAARAAIENRMRVDNWFDKGAFSGSEGAGIRNSNFSVDGSLAQSEDFGQPGLRDFKVIPSGPSIQINQFGEMVQKHNSPENDSRIIKVMETCQNGEQSAGIGKEGIEAELRLIKSSSISSGSIRDRGTGYTGTNILKFMPDYEEIIVSQGGEQVDLNTSLQICSNAVLTSNEKQESVIVGASLNEIEDREIEGCFSEGECSNFKSGLLIRRAKRILTREALDHVSIDIASSPAFSNLLEEVLATWEVSKLLGVSFKEGKEAFLEKIISLERVSIGTIQGDLGGGRFSWTNKQDNPTFVKLDRFLVDSQFLDAFPNIVQSILRRFVSNHNAITLENRGVDWGIKPFKLFNYLMDDEGFEDLTKSSVQNSKKNQRKAGVFNILKNAKGAIKNWVGRRDQHQHGVSDRELIANLNSNRAELWKLLKIQEQIGFQYSRSKWTKDGDRNTRYFHTCATVRKKQNALNALNFGRITIQDPIAIKAAVRDYFFKIYNERSTLEIDDIKLNFNKITLDQSQLLQREFSEDEIWETLKSCDSNKAPGPDGLNLGFFKRLWPILKEDIMIFFRNFYLGKDWEHGVNHTFITLIPKISKAGGLDDYRPISLVGRQILNCSLIANEGIDFWRKKVMRKMGFGSTWISWISKCVTTASISVLVNGVPSEEFPMAKGIRQGCSLSPMLFNIVGELLNLMIRRAVSEGLFSEAGYERKESTSSLRSYIWPQLNLKKSKLFGLEASSLSIAGSQLILSCPTSYGAEEMVKTRFIGGLAQCVQTEIRSGLGVPNDKCYSGTSSSSKINFWKNVVWSGLLPPRVETFLWQVILQKLAVKSALVKRDPSLGDSCSPNSKPIATVINWSPPPKGFIKLNVDATTTTDWKRSGIGGVLRDDNGTIIDTDKESAGPGPLTLMELKSILKGLSFFHTIRHRFKDQLIIESDCKVAVNWVRDFVSCPVVYAYIVKDIIENLDCEGVIRWVNRAVNLEADALAKAGIASGKIYDAEKHLAPLRKMFPLLYTKESLATPDELAPFEGYSSRLAALDYTVSLFSEVFVTTQGGNFPHFLMGHRRFLFLGHAKTIKPDKRKLVVLLQDMSISWKAFKEEMKVMLAESDRKGMMVPRVKKFNRKTSIYTYPLPECACLQSSNNSTFRLTDSANVLDYGHELQDNKRSSYINGIR